MGAAGARVGAQLPVVPGPSVEYARRVGARGASARAHPRGAQSLYLCRTSVDSGSSWSPDGQVVPPKGQLPPNGFRAVDKNVFGAEKYERDESWRQGPESPRLSGEHFCRKWRERGLSGAHANRFWCGRHAMERKLRLDHGRGLLSGVGRMWGSWTGTHLRPGDGVDTEYSLAQLA